MNRSRRRFNNFAAHHCVSRGDYYLRHTALLEQINNFLDSDGVHLNSLGNDLFLNDVVGGLEYFVKNLGYTLPPG